MKKLKVSGIRHVVGSPFKQVLNKSIVTYQEKLAYQNAQELALGLVDLALIPSIDYASHGGYQVLPYGISCSGYSDRLFLYTNQDISSLSTIYLYEDSGASAWLLKILLAEYYCIEPKLIYTRRKSNAADLEESEGLVVLHDFPEKDHGMVAKHKIDLVKVWYDWTGFPFVFHVWCAQDALNTETEAEINRSFSVLANIPKEKKKFESLGFSYQFHEFYFFNNNYSLCLKENDFAGLKLFLSLCAKNKLTSEYDSNFNRKKPLRRSVDTILQDSLDGNRLNVFDGMTLAKEAKLSDLGLVADLIKQRLYSSTNKVLVEEYDYKNIGIESDQIILSTLNKEITDLDYYIKKVHEIKINTNKRIEGFSCDMIRTLAESSHLGIHEIMRALSDSGLDYVLGEFPDIFYGNKKKYLHNFDDWMRLIRWAHRYARGSSCSIPVVGEDMWETWFIFLVQVRSLQDFSYGFRYAFVKNFNNKFGSVNVLRTVALARLFLDNISNHAVFCSDENSNICEIAKDFGANQIMSMVKTPAVLAETNF